MPAKGPRLPVEPTPYHAFWRAPGIAWWSPLLGLLAAAAIAVFALVASMVLWLVVDLALGIEPFTPEMLEGDLSSITPGAFLSNNLFLAALIPATLVGGLIVGQKAGYLHSVEGRMRWGWLGLCMLVSAVPLSVSIGGSLLLGWDELEFRQRPETWVLLVGILLTTPLQAAGEEYAIRGYLPRAIGAWIPRREVSLVVGALVTATVFAMLHGAADPWLNLFYIVFALLLSYLTWRTGGLEAAIAIHVVNNLLSLLPVPWLGLDGLFDRSEGSAGPWVLVDLAVLGIIALVIDGLARRRGLVRETAPGAAWGSTD
ncbi:MAG TPA: CPBP family intramembrane metalloprotease [Arachnia sp.]|nr:CPBP family intramembrane metalloprotease [Arachnia sp.]